MRPYRPPAALDTAPPSPEDRIIITAGRYRDPTGRFLHPSDEKRYELLGTVGSGRLGEVFAATDTDAGGRHVALKFLHPELTRDDDAVRAFRAEIELAGRFAHPNLARVLGFGYDARTGRHYGVTEFVKGDSLAAAAPTSLRGPFVDALRALEFLHARGLAHGRVTPADLIARDERLTLADIGFSSIRTRARSLGGLTAYEAPETLRGPANARSDLYSLGLSFVEAASGARLDGADPRDALDRVEDDALRAVLGKLVDPSPWKRYDRAAEAIADLAARSGSPIELETAATREAYALGASIVSREDELKTLKYAQSSTEIRALAVTGEPGIGKDCLLAEFKSHCRVHGVEVFEATCFRSPKVPFPVFASLLRACLDRTHGAVAESFGPELKKLAPDHPALAGITANPNYDPVSERYILARSVAEFTVETLFAERRPSVLVVNDAQWIDEDSRMALGLLMDAIKKRDYSRWNTLNLVVACRPEGMDFVRKLGEHGVVREVPLGPFPDALCAALYEAVFGIGRVGPGLKDSAEKVSNLAKGNPLFVVELLRSLLAAGTIARNPGGWDLVGSVDLPAVPPAIEQLILRRLEDLGLDERRTRALETLCLLGRPIRADELAALADCRASDLADLEYRRVLRGDAVGGTTAYSVAQEPMRRLVAERMERKPEKAGALAARIEALHGADLGPYAEELASLAILAGDRPRVISYGTMFADALYRRGEVNTFLNRVQPVIDAIGADTREALPLLRFRYYMRSLNQPGHGLKNALSEMIALAKRHRDPATEYWAYRAWGDSHFLDDSRALILRYFDKAIRGFRRLGDNSELANTYNLKGYTCVNFELYGLAYACLKRGLALAEKLGDGLVASYCFGNMAEIDSKRGNYGQAIEKLLKTLAVVDRHHNKIDTVVTYRFLAANYRKLGRHDLAAEYYAKGMEICGVFDISNLKYWFLVDRMEYALDAEDSETVRAAYAELDPYVRVIRSYDETLFIHDLAGAVLEAVSGKPGTAVVRLKTMLETHAQPERIARIHEELYRILGEIPSYRLARRLYRARLARTGTVAYRARLESLERLRDAWRARGR